VAGGPYIGTPVLILIMSLGAAAVVLAYAGRAGTSWGLTTYWGGEFLLYSSVTYGVMRRHTQERANLALLVAFGVCTYLIKVGYSPLHFSNPDELQHWRSLTDILQTHHLFHPNPSLPVSPSFPGLEIATSAVVSITGLSAFAAGLAVSGFARVLFTASVFVFFRHVSNSVRIGGLAAVVFATEPHFAYYDAIFGYQTVALPLCVIALLSAAKLSRAQRDTDRIAWWCAGLMCATALVVTHHLTTFFLLILLVFFSIVAATRRELRPAFFTVICMAAAGIWIFAKARGTVYYLGHPIAEDLLNALPGRGTGTRTHGSPSPVPTLPDRSTAYAAVMCTLVLLSLGWRRVLRAKRPRIAIPALAFAAISYPLVLFVRLFAADSSELAGRALTFALFPVSITVAPVLAYQWSRGWLRRPAVVGIVFLLAAGGVVTGWPPWWERLPGSFRVASFERGVDQTNVDAAFWARSHLSPNNRVAADFMAGSLMSTYGNQEAVEDVSSLFYAPRFRRTDTAKINAQSIRYLVVDKRMIEQLPAVGGYFAVTPAGVQERRRMPAGSLAKFDQILGIDRLYDNGPMIIYGLPGRSSTD